MASEQSSGAAMVIASIVVLGSLVFATRNASFGYQAPGFSLPESYNGSQVSLDSYRGHKVLLVFWMTSCGICRRELPLLNNMEPELTKKGVSVVAIHLGAEDLRDYLRTNNIDLLSLVDADGAVARSYHVSGVPKLVLVGEEGKIERSHAGMVDADTLREWGGSGQ